MQRGDSPLVATAIHDGHGVRAEVARLELPVEGHTGHDYVLIGRHGATAALPLVAGEALSGVLSIQAGAGIVYDSVPKNEWAETMNKARAIFRAVALAEAGLNTGK